MGNSGVRKKHIKTFTKSSAIVLLQSSFDPLSQKTTHRLTRRTTISTPFVRVCCLMLYFPLLLVGLCGYSLFSTNGCTLFSFNILHFACDIRFVCTTCGFCKLCMRLKSELSLHRSFVPRSAALGLFQFVLYRFHLSYNIFYRLVSLTKCYYHYNWIRLLIVYSHCIFVFFFSSSSSSSSSVSSSSSLCFFFGFSFCMFCMGLFPHASCFSWMPPPHRKIIPFPPATLHVFPVPTPSSAWPSCHVTPNNEYAGNEGKWCVELKRTFVYYKTYQKGKNHAWSDLKNPSKHRQRRMALILGRWNGLT